MTTTENGQRDELADEIAGYHIGDGYYSAIIDMGEAREIADAILAAGYRKPRTITTAEELDGLSEGTVILDGGDMGAQWDGEMWSGEGRWWNSTQIAFPAAVLWEPEA